MWRCARKSQRRQSAILPTTLMAGFEDVAIRQVFSPDDLLL